MERHTLRRDGLPSLEIDGRLVASGSTHCAGKQLWSELLLYKTASGSWVAHRIGRSSRPGHKDRYDAVQASSDASLVAQLGRGPLSQEVLIRAGVTDTVRQDDAHVEAELEQLAKRQLSIWSDLLIGRHRAARPPARDVVALPAITAVARLELANGTQVDVSATYQGEGSTRVDLTLLGLPADVAESLAQDVPGWRPERVRVMDPANPTADAVVGISFVHLDPSDAEAILMAVADRSRLAGRPLPEGAILLGHGWQYTELNAPPSRSEAWVWQHVDKSLGARIVVRDFRHASLTRVFVTGSEPGDTDSLAEIERWLLSDVAQALMGTTYWETARLAMPEALSQAAKRLAEPLG